MLIQFLQVNFRKIFAAQKQGGGGAPPPSPTPMLRAWKYETYRVSECLARCKWVFLFKLFRISFCTHSTCFFFVWKVCTIGDNLQFVDAPFSRQLLVSGFSTTKSLFLPWIIYCYLFEDAYVKALAVFHWIE